MFTGIVSELGRVAWIRPSAWGARMRIECGLAPFAAGESIAVEGVCLTVDRFDGAGFEVDASSETLAKTTIGALTSGEHVNLERALRLADRLGGHLVSGHVDGVGTVRARETSGEAIRFVVDIPGDLMRFVAQKGSITVSGVSLTVNALTPTGCELMLIPHTLSRTTLTALQAGARINLEIDLIARYVARLLEGASPPSTQSTQSTLLDTLKSAGYTQ